MMKILYAFVLLFGSLTFAQNIAIRGSIKDAQTKEPLLAASVGVQNSGLGTITNEEGLFQLSAPKSSVIVITYLGYKTTAIPVSEFTQEVQNIALEPSEEKLEEVIVTKTPLHEYLLDVFKVSKARFNKPILLHTYYREFVKSNGKHVKFSDGLLDYHVSGTTKKTKSDLVIPQNRSFFLSSDEDDEDSRSLVNIQTAISRSYDFGYFIETLLDDDHYEDYEFMLKSKKDNSGAELYTIYFEPIASIEKPLNKGWVTFDPKTKLIYEIETFMAPSHQQYARTINFLIGKASIVDIKYKVAFKLANSNYLMYYSNRYGKVRIWNKKLNYIEEWRSDLIVTDFEKDKPYDKKSVFKKKRLYDKPTHYTDKFWQKNNAIVLTAEEEKVISSLEKEAVTAPKSE
ncbi:carboxypeptidase-like regulatory domain-containing protein [Flavobacterium sp. CYK-55]|uniref:carboxypeptidase-like regulatory domain-containing protein n=1 Tax=Flavobacterium sp. CYK-55 TaxID=2835529 RepID=UPI001BCCBC52|nr:carboxypeptidase-like regulatory domain-containing protein [Flavobacterium sp. CYK-55]MBS7787888.1 carboxypeptidase-like regulatory domain-containing protein [Flavobacterium sp. CYK-55]